MLKKIRVSESNDDQPISGPPLPQFFADDSQIPEIKDWEVGGRYKLVIEVEQRSKSKVHTSVGDKDTIDGRFDIVAYKHLPEKDIKDMTDEEFGEYEGKALSKGKL